MQKTGRVVLAIILLSVGLMAEIQGTARAQGTSASAVKQLPFVSAIFGDNMVLQRDKLNTLWGWSETGDTIRVQVGRNTEIATAGADHRWQVRIQPPPAGGPYTIKIEGRQSVELHNILVGDVWLCGGQSNMSLPLIEVRNGEAEVKTASFPTIRVFSVAAHPAYHRTEAVEGVWKAVSPEAAAQVSAVAYYFARRVQHDIHVPIGLVVDALGGSPAESWASAAALSALKDFDVPLKELQRFADEKAPEYGNYVMHWYDEYDVGQKENWGAASLNDSSWKKVEVPGGFADLGVPHDPALVWFRKEITLPDPLPDGRSAIFLGSIQRMDTVFINGTPVGGSAWVENPRVYPLRDGILKSGRNEVAIRVLKTEPDGGFLGNPDALHLTLGDQTRIPLAGTWKGKVSVDARSPHPLPISYENWPVMPTVLYQGMLAPIAPLALTGAIWYQGEQNSDRGYQYRRILPTMIADWRKLFDQGNFPFYVVSLPAFKTYSATPIDDSWAETRESQSIVAASVPNSCLAVTIDTGDPSNLHPKDKQPVGERLARCALAEHYGEKVVFSGPTLVSADRMPSEIHLHFSHTEQGLFVEGEKLTGFAIAGDDRKWHWADARIEGDTVIVSSVLVPNPKQARYAWQGNPKANLFNGAGLPAGPFRTDTWPGITDGHRPY